MLLTDGPNWGRSRAGTALLELEKSKKSQWLASYVLDG